MSTLLWLTNAASGLGTGKLAMQDSGPGAASTTAITNTAASGTNIVVTQTAGGTALSWWYRVGAAITISGLVGVNVRGLESNALANAGAGILIERYNAAATTLVSTIVADTTIPATISEYTTADAVKTTSFTPTSTAIAAGEWIKVTLKVRNVGTMATGYTVTNTYNGPTSGAAGDTFISFTETLPPYPAGAWSAKLPKLTSSLTPTQLNSGAWGTGSLPRLAAQLPADYQPYVRQSAGAESNTSGTTLAAALPRALTPGSTLVATFGVFSTDGTTVPTITDTRGLNWVYLGNAFLGGTFNENIGFFYARNPSSSDITTVTSTYGAATTPRTLVVHEVANLDPGVTPIISFPAGQSNASTTPKAPAITTGTTTFTVTAGAGGTSTPLRVGTGAILDYWGPLSWFAVEHSTARKGTVQPGFAQTGTSTCFVAAVTFRAAPWPGSPVIAAVGTPVHAASPTVAIPVAGAPAAGAKVLVWVSAAWPDLASHFSTDITIAGFTWAGSGNSVDATSTRQTAAFYRNSDGTDSGTYALTVAGNGAANVVVDAVAQLLAYPGSYVPVGTPFSGAGINFIGGISLAGGAASSGSAISPAGWPAERAEVFAWSPSQPAVTSGGQLVWDSNLASSSITLDSTAVVDIDGFSATYTPADGTSDVQGGFVHLINGVAPVVGTLAATLPTLVGSLGELIGGVVAARLPVTTGALTAAAANSGALAGQLASVLTGSLPASQVNAAVLAVTLPLATSSISGTVASGVTLQAVLPTLTGVLSGTMTDPGVTSASKLPLLTTALAPGMWNNGVWGGKLASALTNQTTATQANSGVVAGQFPLLTCSLFSGNVVGAFAAQVPLLTGVLTATMKVSGVTTPKLPVATAVVTGLATNSGVWGGRIASVLTSQTTLYQANPAVVAGQVASVLTATITGTVNIPGVVAGALPLLTGQIDNTNHGFFAASLPLLTTQLTLTSANNDGVLVLGLPLLMGTFSGGPFYPGGLDAELPGPLVATLTGLSTDKAVLHARLPKLRGHLTAVSHGAHVDISITPGTTRVYGIDAGTTRFRVFVTPATTRYDATKAGPTHTGVSAGNTRIQRGPR